MKTFTCESVGFDYRQRVTQRRAADAADAAEACAKAKHKAYWSEYWRDGADRHGNYQEFTVKAGSRIDSTVRVYENYKP